MSISIDYKSFTTGDKRADSAQYQWWKLKESEIPSSIAAVILTIQKAQTALESQRAISERLYGNAPLFGIHGLSTSKLPSNPTIRDRVTYNLVQSVIDTIGAKIAKNKPKALILTTKGNYKNQRKAKKLNQFTDGVNFENDHHNLIKEIFRDGCIDGTGAIHVFDHYGRPKYERCMVSELLVDELEALYGNTRQLYRVKTVDRLVLADEFSEKRAAIMRASASQDSATVAKPHVSDQLVVAEAWHLPSGPEAKDGMHVITIDDDVLLKEEWEKPYFPFVFFHWSKRQRGFWGQGLAEQIQNLQLELNKLLWVRQRSMHLAGTFKVLVKIGSKVVKEHLNNDIGAIVNWSGDTPPQYITPPVIPQEMENQINQLIQLAYQQAGVSMLSAASQKPQGLDSGKALREFNDIETDRFMIVGQAYQQIYLDLNKLAIATAKDIYEKTGELKVKTPQSKFIESIDWKDVDMPDDEYVMQTYPISSLPSDPEGRLATIQEYIQAGFMDPMQGRRLLDFPDLDQVESLANANEERILQILDKIVDDGEFQPPDQFMDLTLARRLALQYYNQFAQKDLEQEKLQLFVDFMNQIDDLNAKAQQPQQPGIPVPGPGTPVPGQPPGPQPLSTGLGIPAPQLPTMQ